MSLDIVYTLGDGSRNADLELAHSMASVRRFARGYRNIVVIGDRPQHPAATPDLFLPFADASMNPCVNVRLKLREICYHPEVRENFVWMNDDFFFNQMVAVDRIPFYREGWLERQIEWRAELPGAYLDDLLGTIEALSERRLPTRCFEVHAPIVFNKLELLAVLDRFPRGLVRSLYGNYRYREGTPMMDLVLDYPFDEPAALRDRVALRSFFAIADGGINPVMQQFLQARYPLFL